MKKYKARLLSKKEIARDPYGNALQHLEEFCFWILVGIFILIGCMPSTFLYLKGAEIFHLWRVLPIAFLGKLIVGPYWRMKRWTEREFLQESIKRLRAQTKGLLEEIRDIQARTAKAVSEMHAKLVDHKEAERHFPGKESEKLFRNARYQESERILEAQRHQTNLLEPKKRYLSLIDEQLELFMHGLAFEEEVRPSYIIRGEIESFLSRLDESQTYLPGDAKILHIVKNKDQ